MPGWTRKLRTRLTLWYTGALAGLLVILGATALLLLDRGLRATVDASLMTVARVVADSARAPAPSAGLQATLDALLGPALAQRFFQLLDPLGRPDPRLVPSSRMQLPLGPIALQNAAAGRETFETVRVTGLPAPVRVLTYPVLERGAVAHLVQVAMPLEVVEDARARFLLVLLGLAPLALGAAAAGGWFLAGRALAPVEAMGEAARAIEAEDLSRRLDASSDDELGRLAVVLNDMLARLERSFTAVRQFSADAAHELRTPLTILRGEIEVALHAAETPAECRPVLGSCLEEVNRLASLVEDLLFLARTDAGAVARPDGVVDLAEVVRDTRPALEALAARAGVAISVECPATVPVRGSAPMLVRVVLNLADNGIKYASAGGRVVVKLALREHDAVLEVHDSGPGIPSGERTRIFDRFYRGDPARAGEGTGLGLPIARSIVELHGGRITVEGAAGGGAVFRVTLPRAVT